MTLHEAIEQVLKTSGVEMTPREIAVEVNNGQLYVRKDGSPVRGVQISARIAHHRAIFQVNTEGKIGLANRRILPFKELVIRLSDYLYSSSFLNSNHIRVLVILFVFISWKRHSHFFQNRSDNIKDDQIFELIDEIDLVNSNSKSIIKNYLAVFESLSRKNILDIVEIIQGLSIEDNIPTSEFGPFFNELVNEFSWQDNFRSAEFYVPSNLVNFLAKIVKLNNDDLLKDEYSANASVLIAVLNENKNKGIRIVASDNSPELILIGTLNLLANGFDEFIYNSSVDTLDLNLKGTFNCIISKPPFARRLNEPFFWSLPDGNTLQTSDLLNAAILTIIEQLKSDGKAYIIVPIGFLFRQDKFASALRKFLIKERILTGIVSLPKDLFKPYASISTAILVIDSKIDLERRLLYYDASGFKPETISNYGEVVSNLLTKDGYFQNGKNFQFIDYSIIEERNFHLDRNLYFDGGSFYSLYPDVENLKKIGIGTIKSNLNEYYQGLGVKSSNLNEIEGVPYIQVSDLIKKEGINEINLANVKRYVSDIELLSGKPRYVAPNSVLIAKVGIKLKPTLFKENQKALCSNNIIVLEPGSGVLPEYLIAILQNEPVAGQVDSIRNISVVPSIRLSDFISIYIQVPSIEEQREYINRFFTERIQEQTDFRAKAGADDLYNIISRIKHELMQSVSSMGIDIRLVKEYLELSESNSAVVSLNDPLITILPGMEEETIDRSRLSSVLNRMQKCQKDAWETLQKAEETLRIGASAFNPEVFRIKAFLKEEVLPIYENANCLINIIGDDHNLKGDKYQLKVLFKNLIDNAISHGFYNQRPKEKNIINIRLRGLDPDIRHFEIVVENNGKPFSTDLDVMSLGMRGPSNGKNKSSGFGLYHCKKVIENHKGMWEVEGNDFLTFSNFKVKFTIALPE